MCGFVAVVGKQVSPAVAANAVARLEHSEPDAGGAWTSQDPWGSSAKTILRNPDNEWTA